MVVNLPALHVLVTGYMLDTQYEMAKALLEAGADPNEINGEGQTPVVAMSKNCDSSSLMKNKKKSDEPQF